MPSGGSGFTGLIELKDGIGYFVGVPRSQGPGEPTNVHAGWHHYDTTTGEHKVYDGSTWIVIADTTGPVLHSLAAAKGDLIAATAADTFGILSVGTSGQVLQATSGQPTGLGWITRQISNISDVDLTAETDGSILVWDGVNWVNHEAFNAAHCLAVTGATVGEPVSLVVAASRVIGRKATGGITAMTGAETGALIDIGDLIGVGTATQTVGHVLESDGTDLESVLHHPSIQARADTAITGWGAAAGNLNCDTEDHKDSGYTHSTSTNPNEFTVGATGRYTIVTWVTAEATVAGIAQLIVQEDTGGGYGNIAGAVARLNLPNIGDQGTMTLSFKHDMTSGDKIRVRLNQVGAGTFNTIATAAGVSIEKVRAS